VSLDRKKHDGGVLPGHRGSIETFYGSIGIAPAPEIGRLSSNPPGRHAGNLDNRELVAGSTLYIPVFARGALFEIGDGMRPKATAKWIKTAIETSLRQAAINRTQGHEVKCRAQRPRRLHQHGPRPRPGDRDQRAPFRNDRLLVAEKHLTQHQAYQLVSVAVMSPSRSWWTNPTRGPRKLPKYL